VEQIGTPFEIYNNPKTRFVASFVGMLNLLKGKVVDPAAGKIMIDGQEVVASKRITHLQAGEAGTVTLRPEAAILHQSELQEAVKTASRTRSPSAPSTTPTHPTRARRASDRDRRPRGSAGAGGGGGVISSMLPIAILR
jgi:ABC-type Fe3+/spermidine/putrescine transport system ATPase subunit